MGKKVQCPGAPPTTEPNKGDTRLREAGVEAVYCLARGAPKGPNIPRAQLNHQGPLFPGHGYATHSQTWVGEPTWLGVRSDATHQAPTKVGAPCVRVWWPTWLGSVVTLLTKHLAPKVQAPPAGLGLEPKGAPPWRPVTSTAPPVSEIHQGQRDQVPDLVVAGTEKQGVQNPVQGTQTPVLGWIPTDRHPPCHLEVEQCALLQRTPVYEKQGPKWCIASPGGPRRVQTYPGLGSTTRMPFSPDTGKPRTARRGRANPHGSGSVETPLSKHLLSQDTRLREAGVEAVYCLARGAPKGPNIPRAQLNHQGPLFPGHGYATHSQTWVGEPTWLGVRSDATHQAPTKVGAPCVRVWWPTWLGSVVTLLTKHLAPKVQAPPAGLGVRGDATLQTPAFTAERECPGRESFNLGVEDWSGFPGFPRDTWVATHTLDGAGPLLDTASAKEPLWKAERRRFASW
ncbi:hypothetical protein ISCGN_009163 [Ixodes scapularis]